MARPREPINLIIAKGSKHLGKDEIQKRRASEVQACTDAIQAPAYLTAAQKKHFAKLADQLSKIKVMGETDCDTLGRYVVAESLYQATVKELRKLQKERPPEIDGQDKTQYFAALAGWYSLQESVEKRMDRCYKQASALARDLGLTISSRCKLVVPQAPEAEKPKGGKFAAFSAGKAAGAE